MSITRDDSTTSVSLVEHQMLEHIKGALRVTLDWKAPTVSLARKKSSIRFSLESFCRHLERLMAIEEEGGYFIEAVKAKPNIETTLERLANDHAHFRTKISELKPKLEMILDWQGVEFDDVCDDIRRFLNEVDNHDHAECRLLQEVLSTDEGGEG